jgi:hypothetical protein
MPSWDHLNGVTLQGAIFDIHRNIFNSVLDVIIKVIVVCGALLWMSSMVRAVACQWFFFFGGESLIMFCAFLLSWRHSYCCLLRQRVSRSHIQIISHSLFRGRPQLFVFYPFWRPTALLQISDLVEYFPQQTQQSTDTPSLFRLDIVMSYVWKVHWKKVEAARGSGHGFGRHQGLYYCDGWWLFYTFSQEPGRIRSSSQSRS